MTEPTFPHDVTPKITVQTFNQLPAAQRRLLPDGTCLVYWGGTWREVELVKPTRAEAGRGTLQTVQA